MTPARATTTPPESRDALRSKGAIVTLRALRAEDASWLDTWLGAVAASVRYDAVDPNAPTASLTRRLREERSLRARVIERGGDDVGIVVYRMHQPKRADATFEFIGLPQSKSRFGSGMMGAAAAEREIMADGVRTIYAPAPEVHGIDVYFWIRLGYQPLQRPEWPCEQPGLLWMRRNLGA